MFSKHRKKERNLLSFKIISFPLWINKPFAVPKYSMVIKNQKIQNFGTNIQNLITKLMNISSEQLQYKSKPIILGVVHSISSPNVRFLIIIWYFNNVHLNRLLLMTITILNILVTSFHIHGFIKTPWINRGYQT